MHRSSSPLWSLYLFCFILAEGCQEPPNRGHVRCAQKQQKSIKYYFDKKLEMCLPFLYEGCGGNSNRYDDAETCNLRCRADKGICGGGSKSLGSCSNRNKTCPKGSRCVNMAFGLGLCCDQRIQEAWIQENHPKCSIPHHEVVTESVWYGEQELLGRSCAHKFCPLGSKCVEGRWLAHCCRPIIKAANS